jgi:hypothetical protein
MAVLIGTGKLLVNGSVVEALPTLFGSNGVLKPSPTGQTMIDYLPQYMQDGPVVRTIQEGIGLELGRVKAAKDDLILQFYIDSATWGLAYWEEMAGLPIQEDIENLYPERRLRIKAALAGRYNESEYWFVYRIRELLGNVIVKDLDPETHPYRIEIEATAQIVEEPPTVHVTASVDPSPGTLDGQYTYRTTYVFATGETSFNQGQVTTNEIMQIDVAGAVTGGTYTLTFDNMLPPNGPPNPLTTEPLAWNATAQDVQNALNALASLAGYNPSAVVCSSGNLPGAPILIEFVHQRGGQPQVLITADSANLTGGGSYVVTQVQAGGTTYENSESNTVVPNNQQVLLQNLPVSPSGALGRRIYRKKNPSMDYFLVAEIPDNETTYYYDDVSDATVALNNVPLPFENTAANSLGVVARDLIAKTKPAHINVRLTSELFRASINSAGDRV